MGGVDGKPTGLLERSPPPPFQESEPLLPAVSARSGREPSIEEDADPRVRGHGIEALRDGVEVD
jgi:hypothetical protein